MKRAAWVVAGLFTIIGVLLLLRMGNVEPTVAGGEAAQLSTPDMPIFETDPTWPKIPNNWQLGLVSDVFVDPQNHVWVLHRFRQVTDEQKRKGPAAPPVLEFDTEGNFIQAWGGPNDSYDWPATEHGISVDQKGFVWLGGSGNGDHYILKLTRDGKFVMQIGQKGQSQGNSDTKNVNRAADVMMYPKTNEVFVGDGYGNRRVIVFDADSGAFKRMWGAFGNPPTDPAPGERVSGEDIRQMFRLREEGMSDDDIVKAMKREIGTVRELLVLAEEGRRGPDQLIEAHSARVSNDGFVYVCDGPAKRVQVFTIDGKFVDQVFINRGTRALSTATGTVVERPRNEVEDELYKHHETSGRAALSTDPEQRFLYVTDRSTQQIVVLDRKSLKVLGTIGDGPGRAPGQFFVVHGLAVDAQGNLYTAEVHAAGNRRAQKLTFKGLRSVSAPSE